MRLGVVLVALVVVSGLLPQGDLFGASVAEAQTADLCDTSSVEQFTDVQAADYAARYILCMRALELSRGFGDGAYGADRDLTRGQMASFLIRLWTDTLGNQCPEGSDSPFVDISGDTHEANINCLYNLGITKGVTATAYGPSEPLKASQISRFLLRTYQKTDHTCPTTGGDDELDEAVDCLTELRVIPTPIEGLISDIVNRAQMAVYVIGLWHNLAGRGLPPTPPRRPVALGGVSKFATDDGTLSTGDDHSCGLRPDGTVTCWGKVPDANRGGRWSDYYGEEDAPDGKYVAIAAGDRYSCAIRTDQTVVCWGANWYGQADPPSGKYTTITAGPSHSCAIRTDGTATCWGKNNDEYGNYRGQATAPSGQYTAITAGYTHSCAIRTNGAITCWGDNEHGQTDAPSGKYAAISAGYNHSCAIRTDQTVICWGNNDRGEADAPTGRFIAVTAAGETSCGVRVDGAVVCWGADSNGLVSMSPRGVFVAVSAQLYHACGLRTDGTVDCWGYSHFDTLASPGGLFALPSVEGPVPVQPTGDRFGVPADVSASATLETTLSVDGDNVLCALTVKWSVRCWGDDDLAEYRTLGSAVEGHSFLAVSAQQTHFCGLRSDGSIVCWGTNQNGQLDVPEDVPGGKFVAVSTFTYGACGLWNDGTISCWGANYSPVVNAPKGKFKALDARYNHACAIRQTDSSITCWGTEDDGFLSGDGSNLDAPDGSFIAVSAESGYSCGLRDDRTVSCWGQAGWVVPGGEFTTVPVVGSIGMCGVRPNGTVTCWNSGGSFDRSPFGSDKYVAVSGDCGLLSDGTIRCWREFTGWSSGPWGRSVGTFVLPGMLGGAGPPQNVRAVRNVTAGGSDLVVSWEPPVADGGSVVTGYRVEYARGRTTVVRTRPAGARGDVLAVESGHAYLVTVAALNENGVGQSVVREIRSRFAKVPDAPSDVRVWVEKSGEAGEMGTVGVSWEPPGSDGGGVVTGYVITYSRSDGAGLLERTVPADARSDRAMEFGASTEAYAVSVAAVNVRGVGYPVAEVARWCPTGGKYRMSDTTKKGKGWTLGGKMARVEALQTFGAGNDRVVNAGDLGGWVDGGENLSQDGCSWIFDDAEVYENAHVSGNGVVYGNAEVYGDAEVKDAAEVDLPVPIQGPVYGPVYGPQVYGHAKVSGRAQIVGNARVYGTSQVYGEALVSEEASVYGSAEVLDDAEVSGSARVYGRAKVYDYADVSEMAEVYGSARVFYFAEVYGNARVSGSSKVEGDADVGGKAVITDDVHLEDGVYDGNREHVRAVLAIAKAIYKDMRTCPAHNETSAATDTAQFVWVKLLGKSGNYDETVADSIALACAYYKFYTNITKAITPTGWQVFLQYFTAFKGISTSTSLLRFYNQLSDIIDLYSTLESARTINALGNKLDEVGNENHRKLIEGFSNVPQNFPCETPTQLAEHLKGAHSC